MDRTVQHEAASQPGWLSGGWAAGWTQSARCEISADVAVTAHGAASLFIFQETGSERGRNSCEFGFSVGGIKCSLTQLILPEELPKEM